MLVKSRRVRQRRLRPQAGCHRQRLSSYPLNAATRFGFTTEADLAWVGQLQAPKPDGRVPDLRTCFPRTSRGSGVRRRVDCTGSPRSLPRGRAAASPAPLRGRSGSGESALRRSVSTRVFGDVQRLLELPGGPDVAGLPCLHDVMQGFHRLLDGSLESQRWIWYRSTYSVPSRCKLWSTSLRIALRDSPAPFGPSRNRIRRQVHRHGLSRTFVGGRSPVNRRPGIPDKPAAGDHPRSRQVGRYQVFSCSLVLLWCMVLAAQLASRVRASWLGDSGSAV
jgi:hypothetical protein